MRGRGRRGGGRRTGESNGCAARQCWVLMPYDRRTGLAWVEFIWLWPRACLRCPAPMFVQWPRILCAIPVQVAEIVGNAALVMQAANVPHNVLICDSGRRTFIFPQCYAEKQARGEVPEELLATGALGAGSGAGPGAGGRCPPRTGGQVVTVEACFARGYAGSVQGPPLL